MNTNKLIKLVAHVIGTFTAAIFVSYLPESMPTFFGDWFCNGHGEQYHNGIFPMCNFGNYHGPTWHWGFRHWLLFIMGLCLFGLSIAVFFKKYDSDDSQPK